MLHRYGAQLDAAPDAHLPVPSQKAPGVNELPVQLAGRHPTDVDHGLHAPLPLHVPSFEQSPDAELLATHRRLGSVWPS